MKSSERTHEGSSNMGNVENPMEGRLFCATVGGFETPPATAMSSERRFTSSLDPSDASIEFSDLDDGPLSRLVTLLTRASNARLCMDGGNCFQAIALRAADDHSSGRRPTADASDPSVGCDVILAIRESLHS